MKTFKIIALFWLVVLLPVGCGDQLVEFGGHGLDAGNIIAGGAGTGGHSGAAGHSGTGGVGGTANLDSGIAGMGGIAGTAGTIGLLDAGFDAGDSGDPGDAATDAAGDAGDASSAPFVTIANPDDGDLNVALNKTITATFSETMNPQTITDVTFTLMDGVTPIAGQVTFSGSASNFVASFNPDVNLDSNTLFTATITVGATDLTGNPLNADYVWTFTTGTQAAQTVMQDPVVLGSSSNFAILASAGITNIATSNITGDVGLTPDAGSNITGLSEAAAICTEITGLVYVVDNTGPSCRTPNSGVILTNAKDDAQSAFDNARNAVRGTPQSISGNLNGLTLYPGLYESGTSLQISPGGFLYLDAQGDSNAVFIIRSATSITTEDTSEVVLTKGAKANNVYWTSGSTITLGTDSIMKGTLIAGTSISLLTGAELEGRALNQGPLAEAITLDSSTIALPLP